MLYTGMNQRLKLHGLRSVALKPEELSNQSNCTLVTVSGYEERSRFFAQTLLGKSVPKSTAWAVIGFKEHPNALSRPENDTFYSQLGKMPHLLSTAEYESLEHYLTPFFSRDPNQVEAMTVHVDYSCMPRNWYCNLVGFFDRVLFPGDEVFFWYC